MKQSPPNLKFDGDYFRCFLFMFIFFLSFRCSFLLASKVALNFLGRKSAKSSSDRNLNLGFLFLMQLSSRSKLRKENQFFFRFSLCFFIFVFHFCLCRFLESKRRKELSALLRFGLRFTRCTRSGQLGITGKDSNALPCIACRCLRHTLRLLAAACRSSAKSSQCAVKHSVSYVWLF